LFGCVALFTIDIAMQGEISGQVTQVAENREMRKQLSVTIATRFNWDTASVLREVAQEKGIGVTTLIRMWTLDRLKRLNRNHDKRG
jgi:hypothetical protein